MGAEKHGPKGGGGYVGGFFHLFDWNGKSRKKLFANKSDSSVGSKQGKKHDENLPMTRFHLLDEDDNEGVSSVRGGSDYSCASSVTDDGASGIRAPGVVARLMGLDSLPTSSVNEPYASPLFVSRPPLNSCNDQKTHEFLNEYRTTYYNNQPCKVDGFSRETVDSRVQKMQNVPIKRFQSEPLPPKSAKSMPITHQRLLSPIKGPGFISPKSAAHIMEAAAKILEPGVPVGGPKGKMSSLGSSSIPIKVRDLKGNVAASQRDLKLPEGSRKPVESNAVKLLKGQSLNKSWNGSEETPVFRATPDLEETHPSGSRNKGKSVSLAIQAKVNVQKREGMSSSDKSSLTRKEEDGYRINQTIKSQQNTLRDKQHKVSSSSVLRQNNQKQNCVTNRDKLPMKPSVSHQQGRRVLSADTSSGQSKTGNMVSVNSKVGSKKDSFDASDTGKEVLQSRMKNFPRKKRAMSGNFHCKKNGSADTNLVHRAQKSVQSHEAINEHKNWAEDLGRRGMDVVSFTFTSPMNKPALGSQSSGQMEKQENMCCAGPHSEKLATEMKSKKVSMGLNVIGGDALSILLEQKLRELTSGIESSSCNLVKAVNVTKSASILQDLVSALNAVSTMPEDLDKKFGLSDKDQSGSGSYHSSYSTDDGQALKTNFKLQVGEMAECSSSREACKDLDYQHLSPISVLEASSSESCNSSESYDGVNANDRGEQEACISSDAGQIRTEKGEQDFAAQVLSSVNLMLKDFKLDHVHETLELTVLEEFEYANSGLRSEAEEDRISRKALFECVNECLNFNYTQYSKGGYRTWAKGMVVFRSEKLTKEIFKQILEWRSMGDLMVDELVDKDMSSYLGRWTHFEAEGFELGVDVEKSILSSLIDEVVADLLF